MVNIISVFQINGKSSQAAKCVKYRIITKVIDYILSISTCEQQCVLLKDVLQSPRLKYHMKTIGIDQYLSNRASFEHKCLNKIKKIYQHADKCDDDQILKYILEADMVSNPEEINDESLSFSMTQTIAKKNKY